MSNDVETQIAQTMAGRAESITAVSFSADDVLMAGRVAKQHRRRAALAGVVAGIIATVLVGVAVVPNLGAQGLPIVPASTGPAPTPSASPSPSTQRTPTTGVPAASVKLNYAQGSTITPWDGPPVRVALPSSHRIVDGTRVPGGWVITGYDDGVGFSVWWQPDVGEPRKIGPVYGTSSVSDDGKTLVIANTSTDIVAYRLPTLVKFASTTFEGGMGPLVLGVAGNWAVLKEASGDGSPTAAASWNLVTGAVTRTSSSVNIWGMSRDGRVARRVNGAGTSCVDIVPIANLPQVGRSGLCSSEITGDGIHGSLSPDGNRLVVSRYDRPEALVSTARIHDGIWAPVTTAPTGSSIIGWDTATSYFATTTDGGVQHCTVPTVCIDVALPATVDDVAIILNRGR